MNLKLEKNQAVVLVEASMPLFREKMINRAVKKTLTIPKWLNDLATANRINFSRVLQEALKRQLGIAEPGGARAIPESSGALAFTRRVFHQLTPGLSALLSTRDGEAGGGELREGYGGESAFGIRVKKDIIPRGRQGGEAPFFIPLPGRDERSDHDSEGRYRSKIFFETVKF